MEKRNGRAVRWAVRWFVRTPRAHSGATRVTVGGGRLQRRFFSRQRAGVLLAAAVVVASLAAITMPARNAWAQDSIPPTWTIASGGETSESEITVERGATVYVGRLGSFDACGDSNSEKKKWTPPTGIGELEFDCLPSAPHQRAGGRWTWTAGAEGDDAVTQKVKFSYSGPQGNESREFTIHIKTVTVTVSSESWTDMDERVKVATRSHSPVHEFDLWGSYYFTRKDSFGLGVGYAYAPWADDMTEPHLYVGTRAMWTQTHLQMTAKGWDLEDDNAKMFTYEFEAMIGGRIPLGKVVLLGGDFGFGAVGVSLPHSIGVYPHPDNPAYYGGMVPIDAGSFVGPAGFGRGYIDIMLDDSFAIRAGVDGNVHREFVAAGSEREKELRWVGRYNAGLRGWF